MLTALFVLLNDLDTDLHVKKSVGKIKGNGSATYDDAVLDLIGLKSDLAEKACCIQRGSQNGNHITVVDDVITAGTAIRESMEIIQANGAQLAGVLISLDRQERGRGEISAIQEVERDYGCQVISIITLKELIAYLEDKPEMAEYRASVRAYREAYGV